MGYYIYIVECKDGSYYTGMTTNVERRIGEHNGRLLGSRYVRMRRPVRLAYQEFVGSSTLVRERERKIKKLTRDQKRQLIASVSGLPPRQRIGGD